MAWDHRPITPSEHAVWRSRRNLAICAAGIALVWLVVLPALSTYPPLRSRIQFQQDRDIDASAMFYTDLEMMDDVIERNERFRRNHPRALWIPMTKGRSSRAAGNGLGQRPALVTSDVDSAYP